jgi:K+-sensing histidine kinase KdpD
VILKCLGTTQATQSMVENLLTLARADAGQLRLEKEPLDLLRFARECWCPFETPAAERALQVSWHEHDDPIDMVSDAGMLRLVLGNLFDNAVRHADHNGTVTIDVNADSDKVVFEIRNTGCDLSPDEADKVFERFWKHDAARTEGAERCGLGCEPCSHPYLVGEDESAFTTIPRRGHLSPRDSRSPRASSQNDPPQPRTAPASAARPLHHANNGSPDPDSERRS